MIPVEVRESNKKFIKPASMTDDECGVLPVYQHDHHIISCWKLTFKERIQILFKGIVWLWIRGVKQAPVSLGCENPFVNTGGLKK